MSLSEQLRERIAAELPKYPEKRAVLLPALHLVQAECGGWIPRDVVPEIAELLEIPPIEVWEVISFYSLFHADPVGRFHLQVCTNLSCCLRGARAVVRAIEEELDIRPGETTADGLFSLGEVQCLGSCGTAPVLQVNNERYDEELTAERVRELLERLRRQAAEASGGGGGE